MRKSTLLLIQAGFLEGVFIMSMVAILRLVFTEAMIKYAKIK